MMRFINLLRLGGSTRTSIVRKNIALSFVLKGVSIFLSMMIVPITINYVSADNYGIWLTISSVVSWISFFDLGLGNGFRNMFAKSKAKGDDNLASQYVSTTYCLLTIIFSIVCVLLLVINCFVNWNALLGVETISNQELKNVFAILIIFLCLNMILRTISSLFLADQRTALSSSIIIVEQAVILTIVYVLTKVSSPHLVKLALVVSVTPCVVLLIYSLVSYRSKMSRYRIYRPSFCNINKRLTKNILGLGGKFFVIQISLVLIFQLVNVILMRNCGSLAVSQYNISHKYFNVLYMCSTIILTPFWSAFTEAFTQKDYEWMKHMLRKLELITISYIPIALVMIIASPIVYKIWINDTIEIDMGTTIAVAIYVVTQCIAGVYMYLLNGIGAVKRQLIVYLVFAIISAPLMNVLSKTIGIYGVIIVVSLVYIIQAIVGKIQIGGILKEAKIVSCEK